MKRGKMYVLGLTGILLIMLAPVSAFAETQGSEAVSREALMKKVLGLQVPFIENRGQVRDGSVKFYANTFAGTVYVTDKGEMVYNLRKAEPVTRGEGRQAALRAVAIRESLQGARQGVIKGVERSVTRANYFIGGRDRWRTDIPTWREVSLGKVYRGIELRLKAYGSNVEKLFTVYPGGDVSDIKLKAEGAKGIKINRAGELEIETALGTVKMTRPVAYQEINGGRVQVAANYVLPETGRLTYGFQVGEYDKTKPLVIDPLLASTFVGGSVIMPMLLQ
ncbi:MAG: hypothetical protein GXP46_07635 [Deferribacteres bacterium]|nr:hypothetical protein [Deferribacteres bacterium]